MKTLLEQKAEILLTLLENANLNSIKGLTDVTMSIPEDLVPLGENVKEWNVRNRIGLADSVNQLQPGYHHFFFFVDNLSIYFSKDVIYIKYDNRDEVTLIYNGKIDEFTEMYFQLSTEKDLYLSKELYERILKYANEFNWVLKDG